MYESGLVGSFMYQWGHADASRNRPAPGLVVNAQNPLDSLIGDLFGDAEGRYFIIEFKTELDGFAKEVEGSGAKVARTQMLESLMVNGSRQTISSMGHFGCWSTNDQLRFNSYLTCVGLDKVAAARCLPNTNFESFYSQLCDVDRTLWKKEPMCFLSGLGIPRKAMVAYINFMCRVHPAVTSPDTQASAVMFGVKPEDSTSIRMIATDFEGLMSHVKQFQAHAETQKPSATSDGQRPGM